MVYTMPRRKSKKDKRVVEQYEYVKVGKSKTKTKRTKKPKGSGDVVQTVIVQAPGRRRRAAKPKAEVWQPMAAPLVQQVVQPTQVPYQFRYEPAAPIMPVAAAPPKVEEPLITFETPAAFQPVKSADFGELADVFRARSIPKTKDVGIQKSEPVVSFATTIVQDAETQTRKPKAKAMETQTDIPEAFMLPEPEPMLSDLTDIGTRLKDQLGMAQEDMDVPEVPFVVETKPNEEVPIEVMETMEDMLGRIADPTIRKIRVPPETVPAVPDFSREQPMDQPVTMFQPEPKEFVLPGVSLEGMETVQKREDFIQKYMKKNNVGRTAALTAWRNKQKKEKKTVSVPIDINAPLGRAMAAVARTDPTMVFDVRREPEPNVLMVPPQKKQDEITQEVAEPRFV